MPRIGFISVGHADYTGELADMLKTRAITKLLDRGVDIVVSEGISVTSKEARNQARELLKKDVDGIILFLATWIECPVAMSVIREIEHIPFALWGMPMFRDNGQMHSTGSFVAYVMFKGSLDRLQYNYVSLLGLPDDEEVADKAVIFCKASYASEKLKRSNIGLIGYTSMSIYPGTFDHLLMRKLIGPEVDQLDTYTLIDRMKCFKEQDCNDVLDYIRKTVRINDDVSDDDLNIIARMYLALKSLSDEHEWQAISVKCQYELSKEFGMVACVPLSILAEHGVVSSCEGDIPVTVSMLILNYLSDNITAYGDLITFEAGNKIKLSPCGMIPYSLGSQDQREICRFMPGVGFKGIQNRFVFNTGEITILRLTEQIGDYNLVYAVGEGLPTELRQGYMPALDIQLKGNVEDLLLNSSGQHYAMCYGDLSGEIEILSSLLKIKCKRV